MKIINDHLSSAFPFQPAVQGTEGQRTRKSRERQKKKRSALEESEKRGAPQKSAALCQQ